MKIKITLLLILIVNLTSCDKKRDIEKSLGSFDISKNDKKILFSYMKSNESSIYSMDNDGENINLIIESKNGKSYKNPRYSNDNRRILFIENSLTNIKNSTLCIASPNGKNITKLTSNSGIITEAFFRENNTEIIFCKANEYKNYSPIGRKMAHNFDIYSLNIQSKQIVKLTNLKAYSINYVKEIEKKIVFQVNSQLYNGIFALPNNNSNIFPLIPNSEETELYSDFLFFPEKKEIIYIKSYDLYKMDIDKKVTKVLFTSNRGIISLMRKFNNSNKILCSIQNDNNHLYVFEKNKFSEKAILINL